MTRTALWLLVAVAAGGCATSAPRSDHDSPIDLDRVVVEESASTLSISGYGARGDRIARVELRTGVFHLDELDDEVDGRQLRVEVSGQVATHESAGRRALKLPLFTGVAGMAINELLLDPRVRRPLARWQIEINDTRPNPLVARVASETSRAPFSGCSYPVTSTCAGNGPHTCSEAINYYSFEFPHTCVEGHVQHVCCASAAEGGNQQAAMRICGMGARNVCGPEGPGGCAICWQTRWTTFCNPVWQGWTEVTCPDLDNPIHRSVGIYELSYD